MMKGKSINTVEMKHYIQLIINTARYLATESKKHLACRRKYRKMYECIKVQHAQIYVSVPTLTWRWSGGEYWKKIYVQSLWEKLTNFSTYLKTIVLAREIFCCEEVKADFILS